MPRKRTIPDAICATCEKVFRPRRQTSLFCSKRCVRHPLKPLPSAETRHRMSEGGKRRVAKQWPGGAEERFWSKVDKNGPIPEYRPDLGPCWIWTGGTFPQGYGSFWNGERDVGSHAYAYRITNGDIPDDLQLDHLCRVRPCVNPDHLEPVTGRTNVLRGFGLTAVHARKTHCHRGHPFDEANTIVQARGRACRACERDRRKKPSDQDHGPTTVPLVGKPQSV